MKVSAFTPSSLHSSRKYHRSPPSSLYLSSSSSDHQQSYSAMIPTLEQLSNDPFIKQVSYAEFIVHGLLPEDNNRQTDVVMRRLRAQLSHSDGIRGFMVTYLTSTGRENNNQESTSTIPLALVSAMNEIIQNPEASKNKNDLISLACMNVVMPTGMITMHKDPELSVQSQITSNNAIALLKAVYNSLPDQSSNQLLITNQLNAILKVALASSSAAAGESLDSDEVVTYWKNFFQKWGYEEQQKMDIAKAVQQIV